MGKMEYFKELEFRLRGLPERERQNILAVYEELFLKAEANGKSVADIVDSLGFPRVPNWDAVAAPGASQAARGTASANTANAADAGSAASAGHGDAATGDFAGSSSQAASVRSANLPGGFAAGGGGAYGATDPLRQPADPLRDPNAGFVPPPPQPRMSSYTPPPPPPNIPPYTPPPYRDPGYAPPPYREPSGSGAKPWIAALALGFFNLVFILGPYLGLCGGLIGLWVTAVALLFSPLLGLIGTGIPHDSTTLKLLIFGSLAGFGAGLMMAVVLQFITKWFFKLTFKYIQFNWKIIKGA